MSIGPDGGFELDFSEFNKAFFEYALKTAPAAAEKGMFEAISELKNDCDTVTPKTPHLEGNLRGDYTLVLEGVTQAKVQEIGSEHKGGLSAVQRVSEIIVKLIFRMPYAAKWHEAVNRKVNWSEPGVGPKFAESKLMAFGKKYFGIVADRVRETTER